MTCVNQIGSTCLDSFSNDPIFFLKRGVGKGSAAWATPAHNIDRGGGEYRKYAEVLRRVAAGYNVYAKRKKRGERTPIERITSFETEVDGPFPCNGYRLQLFWRDHNFSALSHLPESLEVTVEDSCVQGTSFLGGDPIKVTFRLNIPGDEGYYDLISFYVHKDSPEQAWFGWPGFANRGETMLSSGLSIVSPE